MARTHSPRERKTAKATHDDDSNTATARHDARTVVGAAPGDQAHRAQEAQRSQDVRTRRRAYVRARQRDDRDDEAVGDGPGPRRVIVLGPRPRYAPRPDDVRDDDGGEPPRQRGLFGGVLGGIFGPPD